MLPFDDFQVETFLRTGEHEAALRAEFGDALYEDLANLAQSAAREAPLLEARRRKVFILPGIMGSRLSAIRNGQADLVWVHPSDLATGGIAKIKWGASVAATGTILAPYLRMKLRLTLAGFDAEFMPFDWRQSPAVAGKMLIDRIRNRGLTNVSLVCHSMGGLVARQMAAEDHDRSLISRVVTIGTPNHGSYAPVQVFDLSHDMLGPLGFADLTHDRKKIVDKFLRGFPGLVEMMPDPDKRPDQTFFTRSFWPSGAVPPTANSLRAARLGRGDLPAPDARFQQIIGTGEDTVIGADKTANGFVYHRSFDGDGTVPRDLAEMGDVSRYYCEGAHGWLCNRSDVIAATIDLIGTGATHALDDTPRIRAVETGMPDVISADLRLETLSALPPLKETDFAGAFLSGQADIEQPVGAVISDAPATDQSAYPRAIVDAASLRWKASDAERKTVLQSQHEARPLSAETPERIDAYTRRLLTMVDAASANGQGRKLSRELETALEGLEKAKPGVQPPTGATAAILERVIGEAEEFLSVMFIKRALVAARSVGRIVSTSTGQGFGTGFMIAPGVLMTNHHVLQNNFAASRASVQLRYELEIDSRQTTGHCFALEPQRLFHANERLDMAIVAVAPISEDGVDLSDFGHLPLIGVEGKIRKGQPVNIVQHPLAGRKQVVFRESLLTALPPDNDHVAHYTGDTQPGSSGAPVFSDLWEVIALHHSGVPDQTQSGHYVTVDGGIWNPSADPEMKTVKWIANEGIRVSRLVAHLKTVADRMSRDGTPGADLVEEVLAIGRDAAHTGGFKMPPGNLQERTPTRSIASTPVAPNVGQTASITIPLRLDISVGASDSPPFSNSS
ncbi:MULTISPECIES: trypsin-like peptidase domain-containing protein [Marivita]|uniref:Trypsin-like peptidase domain-containing protein n=1 Tax=Marivita cryptomonadis TaxID=505252 RepID=A0A9Q2RYE2_9RHOB|nr:MULTISPECIES: trypsin-like peptidase domain-containing protein [Marivita]MCR9167171.1 trypsin-like peptidase domain-containing protein [Paracoccaceae bacterium]MBM2320049.1 trypsin-like peptidase domain-containing protein [Marivita cryptomonadis]MBM2329628.1 trypsin-like peptidase domain-containing protein [Marivita cryptomonadis]MBM2339216.1 trypsin-like peptidase domain-containing protein [Marivita cryptomonadis]MBM2343874.1 trypsin-like peptidase domain-containing protein [Marivita crypt